MILYRIFQHKTLLWCFQTRNVKPHTHTHIHILIGQLWKMTIMVANTLLPWQIQEKISMNMKPKRVVDRPQFVLMSRCFGYPRSLWQNSKHCWQWSNQKQDSPIRNDQRRRIWGLSHSCICWRYFQKSTTKWTRPWRPWWNIWAWWNSWCFWSDQKML